MEEAIADSSRPAMNHVAMNTPSSQKVIVSSPSIHTLEPSIRFIQKTSRTQQLILISLVVVALIVLALCIFLFIDKTDKNKAEVSKQEAMAKEVKHINAQSVHSLDAEIVDPLEDDAYISFNLYTTPSGAAVYQNGIFLGTTPIEQKKLPKSEDDTQIRLVIALEGYRTERQTIHLSDDYSDAVELEKIVVAAAKTGDPNAAALDMDIQNIAADDIFVNKPVVIVDDDDDVTVAPDKPAVTTKPSKPGNTGSVKKEPKPKQPDISGDDIVLPD